MPVTDDDFSGNPNKDNMSRGEENDADAVSFTFSENCTSRLIIDAKPVFPLLYGEPGGPPHCFF